jgi:hypothetical protein
MKKIINEIVPEIEIATPEIETIPIPNPEWELTPDKWPENTPMPEPKA